MTTMIIEDNSPQTKMFVQFARTLPVTTVAEAKKKNFDEAVAECNGRPASEFFNELRQQVKEHFKNA